MHRPFLTLLVIAIPSLGLAEWTNDDDAPPTPTETTEECSDGMVWDLATETCLPPEQSTNNDDARLNDARELAYDGQYLAALSVLETVEGTRDSRFLTYMGFVHRKSGNIDLGLDYYDEALALDPDNLLARSYLGQAHVEAGSFDAAEEQLAEIRARGGRGGWPEQSLAKALKLGVAVGY